MAVLMVMAIPMNTSNQRNNQPQPELSTTNMEDSLQIDLILLVLYGLALSNSWQRWHP
jgi:hypothetical protein